VLIVQTYVFILNFPKEKWGIKGLVYLLFFLEVLQTALQSYSVTHWFVIGWGDVRVANSILLHGFDSPVLDSIIASIVQTFYCWRIWVLRKSLPLCAVILMASLAQVIGGVMCGVGASMVAKTFSAMAVSEYQHTTATIWFACSSLCDILIAGSMTYLLLRNKPGAWRTSNFLVKFTRLTVETNTLTTAFAITSLITFSYAGSLITPVYLTCSMTMGKLYTNTLLVMLNSRIYVNVKGHTDASDSNGLAYVSGGDSVVFDNKLSRFSAVQPGGFHKDEVVEFDLQSRSP